MVLDGREKEGVPVVYEETCYIFRPRGAVESAGQSAGGRDYRKEVSGMDFCRCLCGLFWGLFSENTDRWCWSSCRIPSYNYDPWPRKVYLVLYTAPKENPPHFVLGASRDTSSQSVNYPIPIFPYISSLNDRVISTRESFFPLLIERKRGGGGEEASR